MFGFFQGNWPEQREHSEGGVPLFEQAKKVTRRFRVKTRGNEEQANIVVPFA